MTEAAGDGLITFVLFTFDQERYGREATRAVLAQDYSPLQIIISRVQTSLIRRVVG